MHRTSPSTRRREPLLAKRAIAFADIVGSTALAEQHELEAFRSVRRVLAMLRRNARLFNGRVVDEAGDGALAVFPCGCEAVLWAARCHEAMASCHRQMPRYEGLCLRIGVHVGSVLTFGARVFGRNVVVACRLQEAALPGETLVSAAVYELLPSPAIEHAFNVGEIQLKGLSGRVDAYRLGARRPIIARDLLVSKRWLCGCHGAKDEAAGSRTVIGAPAPPYELRLGLRASAPSEDVKEASHIRTGSPKFGSAGSSLAVA